MEDISLSGPYNKEISDDEMKNILTGQHKVKVFMSIGISEFSFNLICNELKSLQILNITFTKTSTIGVPELSKLHNLKFFSLTLTWGLRPTRNLSDDFNNFLSLTRNNSLEASNFLCDNYCLTEQTMISVGLNFPQLKVLSLISKSSIKAINTIIENCQNLKSLSFVLSKSDNQIDGYTFQDGLSHKKLTKLLIQVEKSRVTNLDNNLLKLIECCEKLERLDLKLSINEELLIEILKLRPNLISLKVNSQAYPIITEKLIKTIKENGKSLELFQFFNCVVDDKISLEILRQEFKNQFQKVEVLVNGLEMKKFLSEFF